MLGTSSFLRSDDRHTHRPTSAKSHTVAKAIHLIVITGEPGSQKQEQTVPMKSRAAPEPLDRHAAKARVGAPWASFLGWFGGIAAPSTGRRRGDESLGKNPYGDQSGSRRGFPCSTST